MKPKLTLPFRCYLLLAVLYSYIPVQAQKKRPHIGLKAGAAFSNLSFKAVDPVTNTDTKTSVTFGVFLHIPVEGRFSIRPSIEYVSKGTRSNEFSGYNNFYGWGRNIPLYYIDIPINLLYDFPLKKNKILIGAGPVLSFLLNKNQDAIYASNDIGVNIMTGYEWPIGASICLNYTQGLKNIAPNKSYGGNIQNHYFGLTIGYWF